MDKEKFDLKQLRDHFCDIGEKRWGQTLQLEELESKFKRIKEGREELSLMHIEAIRDDFAFTRWWKMPEIEEGDLVTLTGIFMNLTPKSKEVIWKLFDLLKNIEIVSCILRFIDPKNYGILSPPVENILNIRGKHQVDKYINYLIDLEKLKEEYDFERIADVDMALWALANLINYSELRHHAIYSDVFNDFEQTPNPVKKIMARNSLEQLIKEKPLYKAELFLDSDYILAGLIAGRELEIFIKNLCKKYSIKLIEKGKRIRYLSISELSEKLYSKKVISKEENSSVTEWWKIRCDFVHEKEIKLTRSQINKMINGITRLKEDYQL